jgi:TRAP-type transport system small permease protein
MKEKVKGLILCSERYGLALAGALHNLNLWIALPTLIGIVTIDVVLRFGFRSSLQGATEISGLLLLLVFVLSLPLCTLRHGHVYMELIYSRTHGSWRWAADLIAVLSGLVFIGFFAWQAFDVLRDMVKYGEGGMLVDIPFWPFAGVVFLCGVVVTLVLALQLAKLLAGLHIDREEHSHE